MCEFLVFRVFRLYIVIDAGAFILVRSVVVAAWIFKDAQMRIYGWKHFQSHLKANRLIKSKKEPADDPNVELCGWPNARQAGHPMHRRTRPMVLYVRLVPSANGIHQSSTGDSHDHAALSHHTSPSCKRSLYRQPALISRHRRKLIQFSVVHVVFEIIASLTYWKQNKHRVVVVIYGRDHFLKLLKNRPMLFVPNNIISPASCNPTQLSFIRLPKLSWKFKKISFSCYLQI